MKRFLVAALLTVVASGSAYAYNWNSRASFDHEMGRQTMRITRGHHAHALSSRSAYALRHRLHYIADSRYTRRDKIRLSHNSKAIVAARN